MIKMRDIRFKDYLIDYLEYNNITNKDFSKRIGISEQHLIGILSGERDISQPVLLAISIVTDIPADYILRIEMNYKLEQKIKNYLEKVHLTELEYLKKYNYKYLIRNKYFDFVDSEDKLQIIKDILKFLRVTSPEKVYEIDEAIFYKSKNDKPELLLLWLEKCYRKSLAQIVSEYKKENINVLVDYIRNCAKKGIFEETNLMKKFNDCGVYLVIEDDIPGSKIRGAFKVNRRKPAIYLTHKHKRIADIYFALLHELAHLKTDYNKAMKKSFISYEEKNETEEEADNQAYNWMVPDEYYNSIVNCSNYQVEKEQKYPKCFVVYRLAHDKQLKYESSEYQKYNFLLQMKSKD